MHRATGEFEAVFLRAGAQAGVGQQRHRQRQRGERVEDGGQALRVVGVLRPVDRGQQVRRGPVHAGDRQARPGQSRGPRGLPGPQARVHHHVPHHDGARAQALVLEVFHRLRGRGQQQVRRVVGQHPVVLLRHPAVERAQPGFEVRHRQVQLHRAQGAGDGGVGVAVDEHPVRPVPLEHRLEAREHRAGLRAVSARTDGEVLVRLRDAEPGEEHPGHVLVVVLAGVHDDVLMAGRGDGPGDGGEFDELGARSDDADDPHSRDLRHSRRHAEHVSLTSDDNSPTIHVSPGKRADSSAR